MPYVVTYKAPKGKEISLDQILFTEVDCSANHRQRIYPGTVTRRYDSLPQNLYSSADIRRLIKKLESIPFMYTFYPVNLASQYIVYKIPKRSGGERTICEPRPRLYKDQVDLRTVFEKDFSALYHTSAFAYCKGRSILHCISRHQANNSKWFLKLDFEDFFGNTNKRFVMDQLAQIAPFSEVIKDHHGRVVLEKALNICFLNDGLPQGTPISPMLTNLIMIPIDHELNKALHAKGFVYTRYADDIQISHRRKFDPEEAISVVIDTLKKFNAPYKIKKEKTRFGSSSGRNWNLGLMLNKDNKITIGHKTHKLMKAKIHSFVMDTVHHKSWSLEQLLNFSGQFAYFASIEPKTAEHMVVQINKKKHVNFHSMLSSQIKRQERIEF